MESIGQILKSARERNNYSVADIATAIKAKRGFVQAIEDDKFHDLIAPVYAKGFIKLYAEYVGLDPQPILHLYREGASVRKTPPRAPDPAAVKTNDDARPPMAVADRQPAALPAAISAGARFIARLRDIRPRRAAPERKPAPSGHAVISPLKQHWTDLRAGCALLCKNIRRASGGRRLQPLIAGLLAIVLAGMILAGIWNSITERGAHYLPPDRYGLLHEPPEPYPE